MFFSSFEIHVFVYFHIFSCVHGSKTPEISVVFPELSSFTKLLDSCHVHIINYRYVNIEESITPISLSRYNVSRKRVSPDTLEYNYSRALYNTNRSLESSFDYQYTANFRWYCNVHIFLLAEPNDVQLLGYYQSSFANYWAQFNTSNTSPDSSGHGSRMDYCFLMTQSTDVTTYYNWSFYVEFGFKVAGGGYIHRAVILLQMVEQKKSFRSFETRELEISKVISVCPFCFYETYQFVVTPFSKLQSKESLFVYLQKLLMIRHPANSIDLTDLTYSGELLKNLKFKTYNLRSYLPSESIDMVFLEILYPNMTYTRVYVPPVRKVNGNQIRFLPWLSVNIYSSRFMQVHTSSYSFLTCDGLRGLPNPTFLLFISAFHYSVWISVLFFALIIAVLLKGLFSLNKVKENPYLMPFMAVLEQGVKDDSRRIASFSWLVGTWILVCVILTNAYKGQSITNLTAPKKPLLYEKFSELLQANFTFFSKRSKLYDLRKKEFFYYPDPSQTEWLAAVFKFRRENFPDQVRKGIYLSNLNLSSGDQERFDLFNEVTSRTKSVLWKEVIPDPLLKEILYCNKTAILDQQLIIDKYETELKLMKPKSYVAKSKESILESHAGWSGAKAKDPFLIRNVDILLHSGIVRLWQQYSHFIKTLRKGFLRKDYEEFLRNNETAEGDQLEDFDEAKPLTLIGNLRVVFFLYSFAIFCGVVIYVIEVINGKIPERKRKKKLRQMIFYREFQ